MDITEAQANLIRAQQEYIYETLKNHTGNNDCGAGFKNECPPKFSDVVEKFLKYEKEILQPTSYGSYQSYLFPKPYGLIWVFGEMTLDKINTETVQEYLNKIQNIYSYKSCKERIMLLKNILNYCSKMDIYVPKPLVLRYREAPKKIYRTLNDEEYSILYNYLINYKSDSCFQNIGVLIALETGLRIGEICGLKWEDIDLENRTISVNKAIKRSYDYDTKSTKMYESNPKTADSVRRVVITKRFAKALNQIKPKAAEAEHYICTNKEKPTEPRTHRQYFQRTLNRLNIPHIKYHELRHTFATRAIERGGDVKTVSNMLGHKKCDITLDIYTSCTEKMIRNTVELMEKI